MSSGKMFVNHLPRKAQTASTTVTPNGHSKSNSLVAANNNHHYQNHKPPLKSLPTRHLKQPTPTKSSPPREEASTNSQQPQTGPKYEAFIMTGDLIINLANTKSSERFKLNSKKFRTTPNLLAQTTSNSLPTSPTCDEPEVSNNTASVACVESTDSKQQHHKQTQTHKPPKRQMSMPLVRCSKSEDLLTGDSLTVVEIDNCNNMAECNSSSLNTLLNDDPDKTSSSSTPDNDYLFNDDEEPLTKAKSYLKNQTSSSSEMRNSTSASSNDCTFSSANFSPTRTATATNTHGEQTESSMSESYSFVSNSMSAVNSGQKYRSKIPVQNNFSSSVESSSTPSTTSTSPDEHHQQPRQADDNGSLTIDDVSYQELNNSNRSTPVHVSSSGTNNSQTASTWTASDEECSLSDVDSLNSFHYSPPKGIDAPSASRLAKRLFNLEGFKKSDVSRHLSKNNEFSRVVAEEYLRYFDFTGDTLDIALRKFLSRFCLIGETQERERVLVHFSKRYLDCNNGSIKSNDAIHTLVCALMMLNTDLHGENVGRKMTCGEFIENLSNMNEGENFPRETLRQLYQAIKQEPLEWAQDDDDVADQKDAGKSNLNSSNLTQIGHNPFLEVPNPNVATEYKKGYIMRKSCYDSGGKRTPLGKRGWKMFYATLRDLVLYLHKDEQGFRKNQLYESLNNSIRIHHAFASKAVDYTKKQFVFRLVTADEAEYLFQTSDVRELQCWVDTINLVAASLSAPPLPGAVGSNTKKFQRPLLPVSHTRLNLRAQLEDHEKRMARLERDLEDHFVKAPDKNASRRLLSEFAERESFIQSELKRYRAYVEIMRHKFVEYSLSNPVVNKPLAQTSTQLIDVAIGEESGDDNESNENAPPIIPVKRVYPDRFGYKQAIANHANNSKVNTSN